MYYYDLNRGNCGCHLLWNLWLEVDMLIVSVGDRGCYGRYRSGGIGLKVGIQPSGDAKTYMGA